MKIPVAPVTALPPVKVIADENQNIKVSHSTDIKTHQADSSVMSEAEVSSSSQIIEREVEKISTLTVNEISALEALQSIKLITSSIVIATAEQPNFLTSAQIATLTTDQIEALTTDQIAGLTTSNIASLTSAQVSALSTDQKIGRAHV